MDDTVVGVFDRDQLSDGLVALHRAGLGAQARVLDAARGDLAAQLRRIGVVAPLAPEDQAAGTALIVVSAAGRGAVVAEALDHAGARAVRRVARDGAGFGVASGPVAASGLPSFRRPPRPRSVSQPSRPARPTGEEATDVWPSVAGAISPAEEAPSP